jgi:hypothetical protein
MLYFSSPIETTLAPVVVVPVSLTGTIPPNSLQWKYLQRFGAKYEMEFLDDIQNRLVDAASPGMFQDEAEQPLLLHIAVEGVDGSTVLLENILASMREVVGFVTRYPQTSSAIAIGPLGDAYSWETIEGICERLEYIYGDKGVEFWMYPPLVDLEDEEAEIAEVEVTV